MSVNNSHALDMDVAAEFSAGGRSRGKTSAPLRAPPAMEKDSRELIASSLLFDSRSNCRDERDDDAGFSRQVT